MVFKLIGAESGIRNSVAVDNGIRRRRVPTFIRNPAIGQIREGLEKKEENGETQPSADGGMGEKWAWARGSRKPLRSLAAVSTNRLKMT
jgi:hypothetical protein